MPQKQPTPAQRLRRMSQSFDKDYSILAEDYDFFTKPDASTPPSRVVHKSDHPVEVDECYIGGENRGEGRGVHHKTIVVGAVEVRTREADGKKHRRSVYAGRLRLTVVTDRKPKTLTSFVTENVIFTLS